MVHGQLEAKLAARLKMKDHELVSGVSPKLGGNNEGADPHELLEASLAACTIITVQMYALRKKIPLTSTHVEVKIESEGEITEISRHIDFRGELTPEEKERLLLIAEKCPIHRILNSSIKIKTSLLE